VELILPEGAGHLVVHLDEERDLPDHGGHVLGVAPEREVAVPVGRRDRDEHQRTPRGLAHEARHVAEVVWH